MRLYNGDTHGPLLLTWINFIPNWDKQSHHKLWDEITYLFLNFNDEALGMQWLIHACIKVNPS